MTIAYLGLGSNIGDRGAALRRAVAMLGEVVSIRRVSPVYETAPRDYLAQDSFLNAVVEIETTLSAAALLKETQRIERTIGREKTIDKGPRVIDIDLVLYSTLAVRTALVEVPHPRMRERRFVLAPLADLAAERRHPVTGERVASMLEAVADQEARRVTVALKLPFSDINPMSMDETQRESSDLDLEILANYQGPTGEMEALAVESVLRAAGIPVVVEGAVGFPSVPFEVSVPRERLEDARRIIAEALAAGPAAAEAGEIAFEAGLTAEAGTPPQE